VVPIGAAGVLSALVKRNKFEVVNVAAARWLDLVFRLNRVELNVTGRDNLWAQRPAVFIFNHRNNFDPFIVARLVERDFTGVAKKELERDPIIGTFGRLVDVAFVDRANSAAAVASLEPVQDLARKGISVIVAPEGTRLDTTEVGTFKKGAFRIAMAAGIPIVPIVIRNAELIASIDASTMNPGTVDVAVLPPVSLEEWTVGDLDERIGSIRRIYLDTLHDWPA
jgi:putative phosphoserine phosphatase/1-acylglycerol-3-phosphate O-acyltransferase